jgi:hypothetical protein
MLIGKVELYFSFLSVEMITKVLPWGGNKEYVIKKVEVFPMVALSYEPL